MEYFYYWPDYNTDTREQNIPVYKLHREADAVLDVCLGDIIWCVVSLDRPGASKRVALGAKVIAKKSASNDPSHPDYKRFGRNYFLVGRTGTEFYEVDVQVGLDEVLRSLSFPVRAEHVGLSFQGNNGFRRLTRSDSMSFQEFANTLVLHPRIKIAPERKALPK